jgi:hypothetical protein
LPLRSRQLCNACCTWTRASASNNALCIVITYWLRSTLYRDTAPVPASNFVTGDKFAAPISLVTRHSYTSQNLYLDGKKCAIPSLHRDSFLAKVHRTWPVLPSGNTTSPYCRAVRCHSLIPSRITFSMTISYFEYALFTSSTFVASAHQ